MIVASKTMRTVRFGLLLAFCLTASAQLRAEKLTCPPVHPAPLVLPHLKQTLSEKQELTIVAMGSSSTAGARASDMAHTYPAVLQAQLEHALPDAHVAVINRGVGGQDAAEMLRRLQEDAVAVKPNLVVWQVGANGALRDEDPEAFRSLVARGVRELQGAGIDVVLMDNQRAPVILASADHARIDEALARVAKETGAPLFSRGRLMQQWEQAGFASSLFLSEDGVHHNDRGYTCVARALAASILNGLGTEWNGDRATATASALR